MTTDEPDSRSSLKRNHSEAFTPRSLRGLLAPVAHTMQHPETAFLLEYV
jgi:hypothetical protein